MRVSLSWLERHISLPTDFNLAAALTSLGLEVEDVRPALELKNIRVAQVKKVAAHPQAARLSVCHVHDGKHVYEVVCGAPNVYEGMKTLYASVGAVIPKNNMTIEKRALRGVTSEGMLCSADELMVGSDAAGIMDLGEDAVLGMNAQDVLGDVASTILDITLTPDRGDCASMYGIARDLSALLKVKLNARTRPAIKESRAPHFTLIIHDKDLCPFFSGRIIRNVTNRKSPLWLQMALASVGMRSISFLVDVTNYVMMNYGHPMHCFDLNAIGGAALHVRRAQKGEQLHALDEQTYELNDSMVVIANEKEALSLGGIIGGSASATQMETKDIFLESAYFNASSIARTGRSLNVQTESRYRFERGVDADNVLKSLDDATALILQFCGGEASSIIKQGTLPLPAKTQSVPFDMAQIQTLGGANIEAKEAREILTHLGYKLKDKNQVTPPSWRHDVHCAGDVLGDILRIKGLTSIKERPFRYIRPRGASTLPRMFALKECLASRGFHEVISWSFMAQEMADIFGSGATLANPMTQTQDMMRSSLLPHLLSALRHNQDRNRAALALFEVGAVWQELKEQTAIAAVHMGTQTNWRNAHKAFDFFDMKAQLEYVLTINNIQPHHLKQMPHTKGYLHPSQSACWTCFEDGEIVCGMLHPSIKRLFDLEQDVALFEIKNMPLNLAYDKARAFSPSPYPALSRDFAFILDKDCPAQKLLDAARKSAGASMLQMELFDIYEGDKVGKDKKSLALRLTWQPQSKTMTDDDINKLCDKLIIDVCKMCNAQLRDGS